MNKKKVILINLLVFIFYFIYTITPALIIYFFNIKFSNDLQKEIYYILTAVIYMLIIILIYKKELLFDIKNIKIKNFIKYIPIYLIGIVFMSLSNALVYKITNMQISENESAIREYIKLFPIYMSFSTVIFSPFIEEITFRKVFRNIINNKYIFIIISGVIFGLIHTNSFKVNDLFSSIPYIIMGIDFAYIYYKSDNIFTTIAFHSMHNLILLIIQFIGG